MKHLNKIMAAIDLSTYSQEILEQSLALAKGVSAQVVIVNVINRKSVEAARRAFNAEHPAGFSVDKYLGDDRERRKRQLVELLSICGAKEEDAKIIILYGVPFEEVLNAIDEENADFLVLGQKGRTNLPEFLFGTTAEKLFRHSPVPVFSIRKHE